jgi:hypothetical protein
MACRGCAFRAAAINEVFFEDVRMPPSAIVGEVDAEPVAKRRTARGLRGLCVMRLT